MISKKMNPSLLAYIITAIATATMITISVHAEKADTQISVDTVDMSLLDGNWIGDYNSIVNNRQGYINLTLKSSSKKAVGGLTMISGKKGRVGKPGTTRRSKEKRKPLDITFVEIEDGMIQGSLTPFVDPQSGLRIETVFRGSLVGDGAVEGMFTSTLTESGHSYTGSWQAVRVD
jgi:hypothetical protein